MAVRIRLELVVKRCPKLCHLLLFAFVARNEELVIVLRINSAVRINRERRVSCADRQIEKEFVP